MADGQDTEAIHIVGDVEHTTDHGISRSTVLQTATTHLDPTRTQSQVFSLILHGDGCYRTILHPTVVLHGVAQYHDGHRGILQEL